MPKEYRLPLPGRPTVQQVAPSVDPAVVASPVASPVVPDLNTSENALLQGLTALNPALASWTNTETAMARQERSAALQVEEQGEAVRGMTDSQFKRAKPQEASVAYQRGYMAGEGLKAGREDAMKLREEVLTDIDKPDFDLDRSVSKFVAKNTNGITDPAYLKAYSEQLGSAHAEAQNTILKKRVAETQARREESADASISVLWDGHKSPESFWQNWETTVKPSLREMGFAPDDIDNRFVATAVLHAEKTNDVTVLDRAMEKRPGVYPALDSKRGMALLQAKRQLTERLAREASNEIDIDASNAYAVLLDKVENDPMSIKDVAGEVDKFVGIRGKPGALIHDEKERAALIAKIVDNQREAGEAKALEADVLADPRRWRNDKHGKKIIEAQFAAIWKGHDPADTEDALKRANVSLQWAAASGMEDPMLKSKLNVSTMTLSKDGKTTPQFDLAYQVYRSSVDKKNYAAFAANTTEDDRAMLEDYHIGVTSMGLSPEEAAKQAGKMRDPEEIKRIRATMGSQEARAQVAKRVKSLQSGMFTIDAENSDLLAGQFEGEVRHHVGRGRSLATATELVEKSWKERMSYDGHSNYFLLPNDPSVYGQKATYEKGIKALINQERAADPVFGSNTVTRVSVDNNGNVFLYDTVNGRSLGGPRTFAEVEQAAKAAGVTPEQMVTADQLEGRVRSGNISPEEAARLLPEARRMQANGLLKDGRTLDALNAQARRYSVLNAQSLAQSSKPIQLQGGITPEDISAVQITPPQPGKGQPAVKDVVAKLTKGGDLAAAMVIAVEGIRLERHIDPNGKNVNIGAGYSMNVRKQKEVEADLVWAGVPKGLTDAVIRGEAQITTDQAVRLTHRVLKQYEDNAVKAFESKGGRWDTLPKNQRAALTYLAYSTGDASKFHDTLTKMAAKDYEGAAAGLTLTWVDPKTGTRRSNDRAIRLIRSMMSNEAEFSQLVSKS
jgi:GH24 family phage-related lysozyme (muramidase)